MKSVRSFFYLSSAHCGKQPFTPQTHEHGGDSQEVTQRDQRAHAKGARAALDMPQNEAEMSTFSSICLMVSCLAWRTARRALA